MPNLNGMKFPYTPAGKKRYQQIKKQISQKVTRPSGGVKPINIGRRPANIRRVQPISRIQEVARGRSRAGMAAQMDRLKGQNKRPM